MCLLNIIIISNDHKRFFKNIIIIRHDCSTFRSPPREGVYIYGLYMEGARWDAAQGVIAESHLKELFPIMPVIHVKVSSSSSV